MTKRQVQNTIFHRTLAKGENRGQSIGYVLGHAYKNGGGYLTAEDIIKLTNKDAFETLVTQGYIKHFDKIKVLSKEECEQMTPAEIKAFNLSNSVYIATQRLVGDYKRDIDPNGVFAKGNSIKHALVQKDIYMNLKVEQRLTFVGEKGVEALYKERLDKLNQIATDEKKSKADRFKAFQALQGIKQARQQGRIQLVDFAYKDDRGDWAFGEVITANYTSKDIASKSEFVKAMGQSESQLTFYK